MIWPLEAEGVRRFADGLEEILVVEEKRQFLEYQLKEELYNWREDVRPRVIGKFDEKGEWALPHGNWLLPAAHELTPAIIARAIAARVDRFFTSPRIRERLAFLEAKEKALARPAIPIQRTPYFCPGCPHNTSTRVPEGSRALAGIGCHYMAIWMNRDTATFSHMGGEGVAWVGQAPFTETRHVFANLGDGTYYHSGILAIRQAIAAKVPITYKILFNDAVAMTGGQPVDGPLTVPMITRQLAAEGVARIAIVAEEPQKYADAKDLAPGVTVAGRDELDRVQRELRDYAGVSALIFDQTCAAEKRRRRKRGTFPDPARRIFIHEGVCEGCGDCGVKSNCLAVVPVETEFGRKRQIDQSACNKDYSCLKGFCPSFVTVDGGRPRPGKAMARDESQFSELPLPQLADTRKPYGILVTGVGGSGVVTIGALIGMAAHLDGKGASVLDMSGLAQKGGAVYSHIRIADAPDSIHAVRIAAGEANCVIGGDAVVSAGADALSRMRAGLTRVVVNCAATPTAEFTRDPNWSFPLDAMCGAITDACDAPADRLDATALATALLGDAIATNLFLLGYTWQKGWVPVSLEALEQAIELNGVAVELNRKALLWGRRAAHDLPAVQRYADPPQPDLARTLDDIIDRRATYLADYQSHRYARRYRRFVERVRRADAPLGKVSLAEAVARNYFKLLAYKDEYEVARLLSDPAFRDRIAQRFEGDYQINFHLAPPLVAKRDPVSGEPIKRAYGPQMVKRMRWLAKLKFLRGTFLDVFAYNAERGTERRLIRDYENDIRTLLPSLAAGNHAAALELASLPEQIRGYGHVKAKSIERARARREELLRLLRNPSERPSLPQPA
jgi:indolepyruvate ferredoxin oxidoreductase